MSHLHTFAYTHINPLQSLRSYFSSENVSLLPLFDIFSFSFLCFSSPTQSLAQIPCSPERGKVLKDHYS